MITELSAETYEYKIENAQHTIYCFRIYSCCRELLSEPLERKYIGDRKFNLFINVKKYLVFKTPS